MDSTRREAVIKLALLLGAGTLTPRLLARALAGGSEAPPAGYSPDDLALLDEIGETIIPATDIPGAKAVHIGAFIAMMVTDCYRPDDQARFRAGVADLARDYRKRFHEEFIHGSPEQRTAYLDGIDRIHGRGGKKRAKYAPEPDTGDDAPMPHPWKVLKDLTILGYFTSEIGCTQAINYVEVPGRYDPDVPWHPGDHDSFGEFRRM
jgi:hypothetical protein